MTHTIERRIEQQSFRLIDMGVEYDRTFGKADVPHRHNYYTILSINRASGHHMVDFTDYPLSNTEVHFIHPGQVHQLVCDSRPDGWAMTFSSDFLINNDISESFLNNLSLFNAFGRFTPLTIGTHHFNRIESIIDQMQSCHQMDSQWRGQALGALLKLFLIQCSDLSNADKEQFDETSPGICLVRNFKALVEQKFDRSHKLSDYADELNISPKHLSQTVKNYTGRTGKDYIQDRILLEAKRLLRHTGLSIKEVAYQLGYQEPLHFSAFFKKQSGIAPSDFRTDH